MHDVQPRQVKTGADPRQLPDFVALRDEIGKLTHPARPDVNWPKVKNLALALFEHNGVELQTASWYTLASTHIGSVTGLNEGLSVLSAMVNHQWAVMWPQPVAARVEMLSGLSQRLQKVFRTLALEHQDLPALYQGEKLLNTLNNALARQELKQVCQLEAVSRLVHQAIIRLENSSPDEHRGAPLVLPPQALVPPQSEPAAENRFVYVIHPEPEVRVEVVHEPSPVQARWPQFMAGMLAAFGLSAAAVWGWNAMPQKAEPAQALWHSVAELPTPLSMEQLSALEQSGSLPPAADWLKQASVKLDALAALPPGWERQYGDQIIAQAHALWPHAPELLHINQAWQQKIAANRLPQNALEGWHQGMVQLQLLADRLNELDRQKGKYLTVSELKSSVFGVLTSLRQTVPVEEQLRQLQQQPGNASALARQTDEHLRALSQALIETKQRMASLPE